MRAIPRAEKRQGMERRPSSTRADRRRSARRECEGLWDWNLTSNRIHYSPGWIALVSGGDQEIGTSPDEWLGRVHPDDSARLSRDIETARRDGACDFELQYRLRHADGTYRWMRSQGLVVRNDAGEAIRLTGTQADVTVETVTDAETGLPNRLLLVDRLAQSIGRARQEPSFQFALALIELGTSAGAAAPASDSLRRAAARRLETCLRAPEAMPELRQDDLVARIDDDRLAVLLDGLTDLGHARLVSDRILTRMLEPFPVRAREVRLSPAIGIALSASGYTHPDDALRDAETALHRARVLGGSHCELFDAEVLESRQTATQIQAELETALQRGEFELVYQPVVSLTANAGIGFEALVRWRHPTLGMVSPLDFIPIAERTGAIVPLGAWILQQACRQLKTWQTGIPAAQGLWVSVNVSGVQLRESDLVEQVEEALQQSGLEARHLVLELTENVAMDRPAAATTLLMRLRAMGIRISIDDFGTGYSSLAYLRQFPVDTLKIDRSFVRRIAHDKDTAAIVSGIMAMATELGLQVVAEGVETDEQRTVLQSLQCQSAQGFLFAKPLDVTRAEEFLRAAPAEPDQDAVPAVPLLARLLLMPRAIAAAVAALAVVASAGIGASLYRAQPDPAVPPAAALDVPAAGPSEGEPEPARGAGGNVPDPAPASVTGPSPAAADPLPAPPVAASARVGRTFEVVHLHRFGRCEGRLVVSRSGLTFVPDDETSNDGVTLSHGGFEYRADRNTLTIRAPRRTFRFTMPDGVSNAEAELQIASIGGAIALASAR
jgi:EAL domain-containing protein (putative c-di-GMP-specific phosphodiesterase class I)/GGDEF domain-containing protein